MQTRFEIDERVFVKPPAHKDSVHSHEFDGRVVGHLSFGYEVVDQDDDVFSVSFDEVEPLEE